MAFEKGKSGNPKGRPKGAKHKRTNDVLAIIEKVHGDLIQAKKSLSVQAKKDPMWFYEKIWSKIIPRNVEIKGDLKLDIAGRLAEANKKANEQRSSTS